MLPQALTLVIPGIVNNFIGLFMDTTLVSIVGMTDFLEAMNNAIKDPVWSGPTIMVTGYVFAGDLLFLLLLRDGALFGAYRATPRQGAQVMSLARFDER